jgi:hypothetical protein
MTRQYDSFVVRRWQLSNEQRIEVEHLQCGGRTRADNLDAAFTWINIHCGQSLEREPIEGPADCRAKEVQQTGHPPADEGRNS